MVSALNFQEEYGKARLLEKKIDETKRSIRNLESILNKLQSGGSVDQIKYETNKNDHEKGKHYCIV